MICDDILDDICAWYERFADCELVIAGDFNVDLDNVADACARNICQFLRTANLSRCDELFSLQSVPTYVNIGMNHESHIDYIVTSSPVSDQEMGVPQGSVLSVTLFALKINSIVKANSPGIECSLYVDDFLIVYHSKYIHIIERHLQRSFNMLSHWADINGFKFSSSKTVCMHFCRLHSAHPNPELTLNGTLIPVVEQTKFLGVIFDNKLTFLPHIRYLKEKCVIAALSLPMSE